MVEKFKAQVVDRFYIIAVHTPAGHTIALGSLVNFAGCGMLFRALGARPPVVFANEQDRQFPDAGQIHSFVHAPFSCCAVTEEHHRHPFQRLILLSKGSPQGQKRPGANYR